MPYRLQYWANICRILVTFRVAMVLLPLLPLLLSGCFGAPKTNYYVLTAMDSVALPAAESVRKQVIAINLMEIPRYLSRTQMVTRGGDHDLRLAKYHLWGGSLRENLSRVLLENLSLLLATDRILLSTSVGHERPTLRVVTFLSQFEPDAEGRTILKVRWRIVHGQSGKTLVAKHSRLVGDVIAQGDYKAMVASMNRLLMQLSQEMAQAFLTIKE